MADRWTKIADWDDAYANRDHVSDADEHLASWATRSAAFREEMADTGRMETDVSYGEGDREVYDYFRCEGEARGCVIYVHGGYWRMFDQSFSSYLARGPLALGWDVALPTYPLVPHASITRIVECVARAIEEIAARADGPIRLVGHSVGGHLVSRMVCADGVLSEDVLTRISRAVSISGLPDVRPLRATAMNSEFKLTESEAIAQSPALHRPHLPMEMVCYVGAAERPEFVRQNALLANVWAGLGAKTLCIEEPGRHHFDVICGLEDPNHKLTQLVIGD